MTPHTSTDAPSDGGVPTPENRTAIVVGGGRGIGAATARKLAAQGLKVLVADRDAAAARDVCAELGGGHGHHALDIRDPQAVEALFDHAEAQFGPVSVLVNTAAISPMPADGSRLAIADTDTALLRDVLDINTLGTILLGREYARRAVKAGPGIGAHGRVVFLSSAAAQLGGHKSSVIYIASKAAVIGFAKGLARELAPHGITVNCVAPGLIDTPMLRAGLRAEQDAEASAAVPLARIGRPEEVAAAVAYLVSPDAAYVTGATLDINGGYHMG